jgi:hypothetical protein
MSLIFDATFYATQRPDVLNAYLAGGIEGTFAEFAYGHFINQGWKEGSDPNAGFDVSFYLESNPDVAAAGVEPFGHFVAQGLSEGRAPNAAFPGLNDFDFQTYLDANPDLVAAGITTAVDAYSHYLNIGFSENRPGTPNLADLDLLEALETLQAAEATQSDALAAFAAFDNASDADGAAVLTGAALEAFIDAYTGADLEAEVNGAESASNTAIAALASARAGTTDAQLQTSYNTALTAVQGDPTANGLLSARAAADAAVASHIAAEGSDAQILTELRAAIAAYASAGGDLTVVIDGGVYSLSDLLTDINANLTAGTPEVLVDDFDDNGYVFPTAPANASETALAAAIDVVVDRDVAVDASAVADANLSGNVLGGALVASEGNLEIRADLISDVAEAQAYFTAAQAASAAYDDASDAVTDATDALTDLGYTAPVSIAAGGAFAGTADGDIFIYQDAPGGPSVASTITGFGVDGDDVLFVGDGFTTVTLADTADITLGGFGGAGTLELFIQQVGANTVLYIEDDSFDGSTVGAWDGNSVTLVGVDADSVTLQNGVISVTPAVV